MVNINYSTAKTIVFTYRKRKSKRSEESTIWPEPAIKEITPHSRKSEDFVVISTIGGGISDLKECQYKGYLGVFRSKYPDTILTV